MRLFFVFMQLDELNLLIPASLKGPIIVLFPLPVYALLVSGRHAFEDRAHPRPCRGATSEGAVRRTCKQKQRCHRRPNRIPTSIYLEQRPLASIKHSLMDTRGVHGPSSILSWTPQREGGSQHWHTQRESSSTHKLVLLRNRS